MAKPGLDWHEYKSEIVEATQMLAFSEVFGWTPDEIRSLDEDDKIRYVALLKGRGMANKD